VREYRGVRSTTCNTSSANAHAASTQRTRASGSIAFNGIGVFMTAFAYSISCNEHTNIQKCTPEALTRKKKIYSKPCTHFCTLYHRFKQRAYLQTIEHLIPEKHSILLQYAIEPYILKWFFLGLIYVPHSILRRQPNMSQTTKIPDSGERTWVMEAQTPNPSPFALIPTQKEITDP